MTYLLLGRSLHLFFLQRFSNLFRCICILDGVVFESSFSSSEEDSPKNFVCIFRDFFLVFTLTSSSIFDITTLQSCKLVSSWFSSLLYRLICSLSSSDDEMTAVRFRLLLIISDISTNHINFNFNHAWTKLNDQIFPYKAGNFSTYS